MSICDDYYCMSVARSWGYLTDGELFAMLALARSLPKGATVVNIGAGSGTSGLALAEAGKNLHITTVDISEGGPLGGMQNEKNVFELAGREDLPRQILGDSKEVGLNWNEDPMDMIFVDAGHLKNEIEGDIEAWWPHLERGGIMIFHDYGRDVWPDVKLVVDDFIHETNSPVIFVVDTLCAIRKP